jgi:dihydroorotate dehydrogenase electron transfer subunit
VAPLCFFARRLRDSTRFVVGARTAADVLLQADLAALGVDVVVATEDGSAGEKGLATDALRRLASDNLPSAILACGPHGMLAAVAAVAAEFGVPALLSWEAYMRCGIGVCGSCEHEGMLLCADGPVLDAGI